jgi:hypothetical protein
MKEFTIIELIDKLLGNIEWYGETNHDSDVVRRLDDYEDMVFHIIYKLIDLIKVKHQYQASAKECGNKAYYTLKSIHDFISDYLEEFKEK